MNVLPFEGAIKKVVKVLGEVLQEKNVLFQNPFSSSSGTKNTRLSAVTRRT